MLLSVLSSAAIVGSSLLACKAKCWLPCNCGKLGTVTDHLLCKAASVSIILDMHFGHGRWLEMAPASMLSCSASCIKAVSSTHTFAPATDIPVSLVPVMERTLLRLHSTNSAEEKVKCNVCARTRFRSTSSNTNAVIKCECISAQCELVVFGVLGPANDNLLCELLLILLIISVLIRSLFARRKISMPPGQFRQAGQA